MVDPIPRLLIVDDDEEFLEIIERRFSRRGFSVAAFGVCQDAAAAAGRQRFDAAIVDRSLLGAVDLELVIRLKSVDAELPVIVLSGWSGAAYVAEANDAGACEYLTKPCGLDELEAAVRRALASRASDVSIGDVAR